MKRTQGKVIRSEARNVIRNVIKTCDEEARTGQLKHPVKQATLRAAEYCGVSVRTIIRIRKEDATSDPNVPLPTPGEKRSRINERKFKYSDEEKRIIRDTVSDFYVVKKTVPSLTSLLGEIRERMDFPWTKETLRKILKKMGYKWIKSSSARKILIEQPHIVAWRSRYLKSIRFYRRQNREIIYIGETWVDNSLTCSKYWQNEETLGVLQTPSTYARFMVVHAGAKTGFIEGASLVFSSQMTTGDYHGQMNADNFEKWLTERLIPNIPPNSVIVMDNTSYHGVQFNKPPTKHSRKADMLKWLSENNLPCDENMRKYELHDIIESNKSREKKYKVDEILKLHGHSALRLPPYMCELNPIEMAWAEAKRKICQRNISLLSKSEFLELTQSAMEEISGDHWRIYCSHVERLEAEYWEKDGLLEEAIDSMNMKVQDNTSDSSSESSSSESSQD